MVSDHGQFGGHSKCFKWNPIDSFLCVGCIVWAVDVRRLVLLTLVILATVPSWVSGQQPHWPIVQWDPSDRYSDTIFIQGYEVKSLTARGSRISVAFNDAGKYLAVLVFVENRSGNRLIVGPATTSFQIEYPKKHFLLALSADKAASGIANSGKWRDIFGAFLAGMATRESTATVQDGYGNKTNLTITSPDYAAQRRAGEARAERRSRQADAAAIIREIGLRKNTLEDNETLGGWVYFEKKRFTKATFTMFTGDAEYRFPFEKSQ